MNKDKQLKRKQYWKKYSEKNREKLKEKAKKYYHGNKEKMKEYCEKNKEKIKENHKQYYLKNKKEIREKYNAYYRNMYEKNMKSWVGFIPEETKCEICGETIFLGKAYKKNAIHFDHRHGGKENIKITPSSWLYRHKRNKKNEKIWESCDFGMLCKKCNSFLPTKNRKKFIKNVVKYIGGIYGN